MEDRSENSLTTEFALARRATYVKVDLNVILNNLKILKANLASHTGKKKLNDISHCKFY